MPGLKVLVVGGGIGGITTVLALRQRGVDVQLFEQAAAFGQVGAGLQVSSNAAKILRRLGLGEELKKVATYPAATIAAGTPPNASTTRRSARRPRRTSARPITRRIAPNCSTCC
jgi:2-polyprenyl-6-methoxyphenol hydroxylase-like FAD-dependent oxidoreductase